MQLSGLVRSAPEAARDAEGLEGGVGRAAVRVWRARLAVLGRGFEDDGRKDARVLQVVARLAGSGQRGRRARGYLVLKNESRGEGCVFSRPLKALRARRGSSVASFAHGDRGRVGVSRVGARAGLVRCCKKSVRAERTRRSRRRPKTRKNMSALDLLKKSDVEHPLFKRSAHTQGPPACAASFSGPSREKRKGGRIHPRLSPPKATRRR